MTLRIVLISLSLVLGPLIVGCASPVEEATAETRQAVAWVPPPGCFTETLCPTWGCISGDYIGANLALQGRGVSPLLDADPLSEYGTPSCPGFWVLEIQQPSAFNQSSYLTLNLPPSTLRSIAPTDCASATVNVLVYRHTAAGWDFAPWYGQNSVGVSLGTTCGFGPSGQGFSQNMGGAASDVDRLRILISGSAASGSGAQVPMGVHVNGCIPITCASAGITCGTLADLCGGTLTCGPVCRPPTTCDGAPLPKQPCPVGVTRKCCGTDGWVCGKFCP